MVGEPSGRGVPPAVTHPSAGGAHSESRGVTTVATIRDRETLGPDSEEYVSAPTDGAESAGENGTRPDGSPDIGVIIGAPDLTQLVKRRQTANAKKYRDQVAGMFKMGVIGTIQTGNFPDAATLLWHGPNAATAIGNLCDSNTRIAMAVDMITSPSSPIAETFLALLPLLSQLGRNHEQQLTALPSRFKMGKEARAVRKQARAAQDTPPDLTLKIGRRSIPIRWKFRPRISRWFSAGIRSQTMEPNLMAANVFTDPAVQRELAKLGINIVNPGGSNGA
jgi:hypothetical protein